MLRIRSAGTSTRSYARPTPAPTRRASEAFEQETEHLGVSFEAITRTLERYELVDPARRQTVLATKPRALKIDLLGGFAPPSYHGDVWLLTEKDQGGRIDGSRKNLLVIRVEELGSADYLWDLDTLYASGLVVLRDTRLPGHHDSVGASVEREVLAGPDGEGVEGELDLRQSRPWLQEPPIAALAVTFDLSGPEVSGLSRHLGVPRSTAPGWLERCW